MNIILPFTIIIFLGEREKNVRAGCLYAYSNVLLILVLKLTAHSNLMQVPAFSVCMHKRLLASSRNSDTIGLRNPSFIWTY